MSASATGRTTLRKVSEPMERTVVAQHQAHVAVAARPYAGFGNSFQWRTMANVACTNAATSAGLKSTKATTKRSARHLGMAST